MFYPNCYGYINNNKYFYKGIIASIKVLNKIIVYFICIGINKYIEIVIDNKYIAKDTFKKIGIKGYGKLQDSSIVSIKSYRNSYF